MYIRTYLTILLAVALVFGSTALAEEAKPNEAPVNVPRINSHSHKLQKTVKLVEPSKQQVKSNDRKPPSEPRKAKVTGNKETWMREAGIPESDWQYVDFIVGRESGWDPCAYNPGLSNCNATPTSACGLVQALPCSKLGDNWTDPVKALKWQKQYVKDKYGGYAGAYAFWTSNHWY